MLFESSIYEITSQMQKDRFRVQSPKPIGHKKRVQQHNPETAAENPHQNLRTMVSGLIFSITH